MQRLTRILRHHWLDASDSARAVPDDLAQRLAQRIAASERRHSGEIRLCVEAGLPAGLLWRLGPDTPLRQLVRERAVDWFGRLRIWDTEQNNGVLIYLLLAEHAIEFVVDRGLSPHVDASQWQAVVDRLGTRLREGAFEDGLTLALEEVSALLVRHFPLAPGETSPNELPDRVVRV